MRQYLLNILIATDRLGSAFLGLDKDETISSALGKLQAKKVWSVYPVVWLINTIFYALDPDHCRNSVQPGEGLFTVNYDGAISPLNVIKYIIPLQVLGIYVFFNFDWLVDQLTVWS